METNISVHFKEAAFYNGYLINGYSIEKYRGNFLTLAPGLNLICFWIRVEFSFLITGWI